MFVSGFLPVRSVCLGRPIPGGTEGSRGSGGSDVFCLGKVHIREDFYNHLQTQGDRGLEYGVILLRRVSFVISGENFTSLLVLVVFLSLLNLLFFDEFSFKIHFLREFKSMVNFSRVSQVNHSDLVKVMIG